MVAVAADAGGRELAAIRLTGADPYSFTGLILAWAAAKAAADGVGPAGALGPVEAFSAGDLRRRLRPGRAAPPVARGPGGSRQEAGPAWSCRTVSSASLTCWPMLVIELNTCRTLPSRSITYVTRPGTTPSTAGTP